MKHKSLFAIRLTQAAGWPFNKSKFIFDSNTMPLFLQFHLFIYFHLILGYVYCQADYAVSYHTLPMIDQHALFQLENVIMNIRENYEKYQFFKIFQVNIL